MNGHMFPYHIISNFDISFRIDDIVDVFTVYGALTFDGRRTSDFMLIHLSFLLLFPLFKSAIRS